MTEVSESDSAMNTEEKTRVQVTMNPVLVGVDALAALCGVCRKTIYNMLADHRLGPVPVKAFGRRVLWRRTDVEEWAATGFLAREEWLKLHPEKSSV